MKEAIIVTCFGTSKKKAFKKSLISFINYLKLFKDCDIYYAFSSNKIRKMNLDYTTNSLENILSNLRNNYDLIRIISFFIIPGFEYEKVKSVQEKFKNQFKEIIISEPLLTRKEDFLEVALSIKEITKDLEKFDPYFLLIGHGSKHMNNKYYKKLNKVFKENKMNNYYLTCLEGNLSFEDLDLVIKEAGDKLIIIIPFLLFNGEHVNEDIINGKNSIEKQLKSNGKNVISIPIGLGEINRIQQIFINRLIRAYE